MEGRTKFNTWYFVFAVLVLLLLQYFYAQGQQI